MTSLNSKSNEAQRPSGDGSKSYKIIIFDLGDQTFAVDVTLVREILKFQETRPVPHTPPSFLGVCTIRGEVIPVIDLGTFLKIRSEVPLKEKKLIILDLEGQLKVALAVDSVRRIYEITEDQLDFSLKETFLGEHLACIVKQEGENVLLPDFEKIIKAFKLENLELSQKAFDEAAL